MVRALDYREVRVLALGRVIALCSWVRHFTLTMPLSTQLFAWIMANIVLGGNPVMD